MNRLCRMFVRHCQLDGVDNPVHLDYYPCVQTHRTFSIRNFSAGLLLAILLGRATSAAHGQGAIPSSPDAERVVEIAQFGGVIRDSVARSDGKILAAEGSALVLFQPGFGNPEVLARAQMEHGEILDLAEATPYTLVLAEDGLLVLPDSGDTIPDLVGFSPSSGQSMDVAGNIIAIASQEAGIHLLWLEDNGSLTSLSTVELSSEDGSLVSAEGVSLSDDSQQAYVSTEDRLYLVDTSNPSAPVVLGPLPGVGKVEATASAGPLLAVGSEGKFSLLIRCRALA